MCRHKENTDMIAWNGAVWLVQRSGESQTLGPNSALHVYRSDDNGASFVQAAFIDAPVDRDIRDPAFYTVGQSLFLKALARVHMFAARDANVDTATVAMESTDGVTWSGMRELAPHGWSFWRVKEDRGVSHAAACQSGDTQVVSLPS